ncbi:MAG: uroporphyrinogen decarboxylase family protein [Planctomycetes bacterium]|nr:uroporphyrinogen decarboxylase family protein [Planctomycetota bacterium]
MITLTGTLSKAWMNRALGVAFDRDYYFDPAKRHAVDCRCNEYAAEAFPAMGVFYSESNLGRIDYWDKSQVLIGGIQPNMILGMLLGADFLPADDRDADITPCCLKNKKLGDLPATKMLLDHDLVRLFDEQIRSARRGRLRPIPPFFWDSSGRATIHGILTTAQKLCGEGIFMDMLTEPAQCQRLLNWIADAYLILCRHFADIADLPIVDVHVGECSCCMISPALVEEFVAPVTSRIGAMLGPVRFHSCGTSTHLLGALTRIDPLGSLDFGSATSIRKAREIFGPEMPISIAPSPQDMSAESTAPIWDWAGRVLQENAGGDLGYVFHLEPSYNVETIYALTDFVQHQAGGSSHER